MTIRLHRRSAIVALLVCTAMGAYIENARADEKADRRREQQRVEVLRQCQAAVEAGQFRQAKAVLLRIRKERNNPQAVWVDSLLARCAVAERRLDEAWAYVAPHIENRRDYRPALDDAYLAAGDILMAKQDHAQAARLMDWVATHSEGRTLVLAAEKCGQAYLAQDDHVNAVRAFEFAIKYGRQNLYDDGTLGPLFDRLNKQLKQARGPLEEQKRAEEIERLGEDFYLFREAEELRRIQQEYKEAFTVYEDLIRRYPDSVFAEAARFYQPLCLVHLKAIPEAERRLQAFYDSNPTGAYRGEALLELGRIALERRLDLDRADRHFSKIDAWIESAKRDQLVRDFYAERAASMKDAAKQLAEAPRHEKKYDQWGNIIRVGIQPGQLVNHITCDWYLDDLAEQSAKFLGFIRFAQGKKQEALAYYDRILMLDEETKNAEAADEWNDYRRLKWGAENGYLCAYPQELRLYSKAQQGVILIGDFYQVTEQFGKATAVYRRLLDGEFGKLSSPQQDYLHFAVGSCVYRERFTKDAQDAETAALAEFDKVLARQDGTWTEFRATKAYSNLGIESRNPKTREKAEQYLLALASSPVKNEYTQMAKIDLARRLIRSGRKEDGLALLQRFKPDDGQWYELAQYHLSDYTGN